jgi:hypothetical protein
MTTIDVVDVLRFDERLRVGDTVRVRWTNSGYAYEGQGEIVKLNDCSARVKLAEAVESYPAGFVVTQDRCNFRTMLRWSPSNAILPVIS